MGHGFTAAESGVQPAAALLLVTDEAGIRSVRVAHGEASAGQRAEPAVFTSVAQAVA